MERKAIIVGAGIGGLSASIALRAAGFRTIVVERAPELRAVGAGIALWPNAVLALRRLGVGAAVEAAGAAVIDGGLRSWRGAPLAASAAAELDRHFGAPLVMVHRAALLAALLTEVDEEDVRLGSEVVALRQDAHAAEIRLSDGSVLRGDVVIGADGLRSRIRAELVGDGDPRYSGYTAWRGVLPVDAGLLPRMLFGEWWGKRALFGIAPLGGSQTHWWASRRTAERPAGDPLDDKLDLARAFAAWQEPIPEMIDSTMPEAILSTPLYDRRPLRRWSDGRVALLGDAAHPMLPNLGQGACQAIADAVALAHALSTEPDVTTALSRYSARRAAHVGRIVRRSRQLARVGHLANPAAVALRNLVLPGSTRRAIRQLQPILAS